MLFRWCFQVGLTAGWLLATMVFAQARPSHHSRHRETNSAKYKAEHIIVPNIEFRSTTLADAVEYLRQESARLDTDPKPEHRGVNIFVKMPPPSSTPVEAVRPSTGGLDDLPAPSFVKNRVTLIMRQIPVLEALRYLALQVDLNVVVEKYAVCLVPPGTKLNSTMVSP